jgi:hypothetical protein
MLSGRRLDLVDPSPLDVEIEDIAHGLARVARWNGQTLGDHIYSVAQHSLLVEAIARELEPGMADKARLAILLHDAPEYVIGDLISPFKAQLSGEYRAIEKRLLAAIFLRFGLPSVIAPGLAVIVKRADRAAAFLEATRLAGFAREEALEIFGAPPVFSAAHEHFLAPWSASEAKARFLTAFAALDSSASPG